MLLYYQIVVYVDGTVTAQWLCVFVDYCGVGKLVETLKWLLVSYHNNNGNLIKTKKKKCNDSCFFFLTLFVTT